MIFIFAKKMVAKEDAGKLKMSRQRLHNQDNNNLDRCKVG